MRESSPDQVTYQAYVIGIRSYEMKAGGWVPKALGVVPEAEGNRQQERQSPAGATLALRADAEALAGES
jgi:hypothetical protein